MRLSEVEYGHLDRAAVLGRRGWGRVHPNPMVGCVVVRDERVVGEGWHAEFGGSHAEVVALAAAGELAAGATVFVSLEPCDHDGKTPPCSSALVRAGVAKVVFGAADPGAESGGGAGTLRSQGVDVTGPVWDLDRARAENPAFFHAEERGAPWIALKLALSVDGKIAAAPEQRTRISGDAAQRWAHALRSGFDALLVGSRTARVDDPLLSVREGEPGRIPPARIVLDTNARMSPRAAMFSEPGGPVVVVTAEDAEEGRVRDLERAGARALAVARGPRGVQLEAVFSALWELGFRSILCEGGGVLAGALLADGAVERLYLLSSPRRIGVEGVPGFGGVLPASVWRDWRPSDEPRWLEGDRLGVFRRRY